MPTYNGPVREGRNMATRPRTCATRLLRGSLFLETKDQGPLTGQSSFLNGPSEVFRAEGVGGHPVHRKNCRTRSARISLKCVINDGGNRAKTVDEMPPLDVKTHGRNNDLNDAKRECRSLRVQISLLFHSGISLIARVILSDISR